VLRATQDTTTVYIGFMYATIMLYGDTFQSLPFSNISPISWSYNPINAVTSMVWANPRSLATTYGIIQLFSSPTGTKMFQFPAFASIIQWIISLQDIGLSHSEIFGLMVICTYPKLIAAYHVLHRLREPRHPPCALAYFLQTL
jgi:hypothetical protein